MKARPGARPTLFALAVLGLFGAGLLFELRGEPRWLNVAALAALAGAGTALAAIFWAARRRIVPPSWNEAVVTLTIALSLGLVGIELALRLAMPLLPPLVRELASEAATDKARNEMREVLAQSPFVRFKPLTPVRSMGERGEDFVAEWTTDRRGFKNIPSLLDGPVTAVAVGDSFTEGMGVAIADTWPSVLTRDFGLPTYNVAIQGFSPTQMLGALTRFGLDLAPKVCIVGYTGTIFSREIQHLAAQDEALAQSLRGRHEVKRLNRLVTLALLRAFQRGRQETPLPADAAPLTFAPMAPWRSQVTTIDRISPERLDQEPGWISTLKQIAEMDRHCREAGAAATLVLYYPHRSTVYHAKAVGQALPEDAFELVEARRMKAFAERQGLSFLDLTPAFLAATAALNEASSAADYPFLSVDGHPSPSGQRLIAAQVAGKLREMGVP
ncbi:MAG: hypothetical protein HQL42_02545 [Alphaproteobacteria bacterium]|nr:hypothetical protein [Alphaproteobacteria bacterium]